MKFGSDWRWTCPHCKGGQMTLISAERHLRMKHADCWSCHLEKLMIDAMLEGHVEFFLGPGPFDSLNSRA